MILWEGNISYGILVSILSTIKNGCLTKIGKIMAQVYEYLKSIMQI